MKHTLIVRSAERADVTAIKKLLDIYAAKKIVLPRSAEDILFYLRNFVVCVDGERVCGCAAARDFGNNLFEVRSLVVDPDYQRRGIGRLMVQFIIDKLKREFNSFKLFALTYQSEFFRSLGFRHLGTGRYEAERFFPEKVWSDCVICPKFDCCDEEVFLYEYSGR